MNYRRDWKSKLTKRKPSLKGKMQILLESDPQLGLQFKKSLLTLLNKATFQVNVLGLSISKEV